MQRATATIRAAKFVAGSRRVPERENCRSPREASVLACLRIFPRKISFCERWIWAAITVVARNEQRQQRKRTGSHHSGTCPSGQARRTTTLSRSFFSRRHSPCGHFGRSGPMLGLLQFAARTWLAGVVRNLSSPFPGRETVRRPTALSHSASWPQEILRRAAARVRALGAHRARRS